MLHIKNICLTGFIALAFSSLTPKAKADVVTSIQPTGFIAAAIADGVTPVRVILPAGASEHDYALRPSDIKSIKNAQLVVWVGPEMEAFMPKAVAALPANRILEIAALPQIKPLLIRSTGDDHQAEISATQSHTDHEHGEYNMHLWLSPEIAKITAVAIYAKLLELMPRSKDKLDANLHHFVAQLAQYDKNIEKQLALVKDNRYFVFHDAYGYFEKHYGLSPLGYFTVNPEIQPGAQRLHQIRTQLVEQKAVCVFSEPQFRPAVIDAVARGTSVRKGTLDPLGTDVRLGKDSYVKFLSQLANQYTRCLKGA